MKKSCGICVNCIKLSDVSWVCENCDGFIGKFHDITPPYDEACKYWSDNPKDKNKQLYEAMVRSEE